ncbi:hypothetical protein ACFVVC_02075 [Pseudarthrobacter sp. NPDC058196]|uniref:hypothetical protein n=1 Tax=Pseudarthrobacter sp. NPDC058196 TaxID=3346376 RepID=UPI0036DF8F77
MTMTTTAHPATTRPQDPFDPVMRSGLRDDTVWAEVTTTADGIAKAEHWLKSTAISISQQLAFRQDEAEIQRLSREAQNEPLVEFLQWCKSALYLKSLCEKRLIDIKHLRAAEAERAEATKALLTRLAQAVLSHENGKIGDGDLHRALDGISLPGTDAPTLREYLQSRDGSKD